MRLFLRIVTVLALLFFAGSAYADGITFTTPIGAKDSAGDPVSAQANFSLSGSTLTLTLTNLQLSDKNAGQLLTDVFFTLSAGTATLSSQTGDLIMIGGGGAVTDLGVSNLGWGFGSATVNGNSGFEVCVICQGSAHASPTPSEGIVGPGPYTTANPSIANNGPHNPFVNQTASFVLTGVSSGAEISNVTFSFGTSPGDNIATPEPGTLGLLMLGFIALAVVAGRKRLTA